MDACHPSDILPSHSGPERAHRFHATSLSPSLPLFYAQDGGRGTGGRTMSDPRNSSSSNEPSLPGDAVRASFHPLLSSYTSTSCSVPALAPPQSPSGGRGEGSRERACPFSTTRQTYSDEKVANRTVRDFGREIAHAAVSRRPPISLPRIVARTHMYTYDANVWDFVPRSTTIFCRPAPNPNITIRNFCIAVRRGSVATHLLTRRIPDDARVFGRANTPCWVCRARPGRPATQLHSLSRSHGRRTVYDEVAHDGLKQRSVHVDHRQRLVSHRQLLHHRRGLVELPVEREVREVRGERLHHASCLCTTHRCTCIWPCVGRIRRIVAAASLARAKGRRTVPRTAHSPPPLCRTPSGRRSGPPARPPPP
jgi:hypothetical protein